MHKHLLNLQVLQHLNLLLYLIYSYKLIYVTNASFYI